MTYEPSVMKYLYGKRPLTVESYETVSHALDVMENANKNAIGVQNFGKFAGIFTQSDFIKRVLRHDLNPHITSIYDVMTANPQTVTPDCGITAAYEIMVRRGINHLPVVDRETFASVHLIQIAFELDEGDEVGVDPFGRHRRIFLIRDGLLVLNPST